MTNYLLWIYFSGYVISFISVIIYAVNRDNQILLIDVATATIISLFSWIPVVVMVIWWLEDNPIVLWGKK